MITPGRYRPTQAERDGAAWRSRAAICIAAGASTAVSAQQVAVMVNGDPITSYDIDQRSRSSSSIARHKTPSRQEISTS